ncbi:MAG: TIR domain-containing protein [Bacteroidetes bacterium]|nr:TIR domain-containing protein [Bacteroidota bacterium]
MHKVFISYHHDQDQHYKNYLVNIAHVFRLFIDRSVNTGDINGSLSDERIRQIIRDEYLRDSTVTIVLVGQQTKHRKHVDWEIYSSMFDGAKNKKSGILVINLPGTSELGFVTSSEEKIVVYPDIHPDSCVSVNSRTDYEQRYPHMPARIIDNLLKPEAKISVVPWNRIITLPHYLTYLIDAAFKHRRSSQYDLSRPLRRRNSNWHNQILR